MLYRGVREFVDLFDRGQALSTTAGMNGWTIADTSASGTPTYLVTNGVGMVLTLEATSEVQNVCMSHGDVLTLPTIGLLRAEFTVKLAAVLTGSTITWGLGTARNDTILSVTSFAGFRVLASGSTTNVLIDCRDGTTTNNSVSAVTAHGGVLKTYGIDFSNGLADIRFDIDGVRVAPATTFTMAALTSTSFLQPIIQIQKTSSTNVSAITIPRIAYNYSYGLGT